MDTIEVGLTNLEISCIIGCTEEERKSERKILVNICLQILLPSEEDSLESTVDYFSVANTVTLIAKKGKFFILESLAKKTCDVLLNEFTSIQKVKVHIVKPKPFAFCETSYVTYEKKR